MDHDEFAKMEEFLQLIEASPKEKFIKQNQRIERQSHQDDVKENIKEMKISIGGQEKWSCLRRVEKIIQKLGIEDENITDTELYQQGQLRKLWNSIDKHFRNKKWDEFDKAQGEVEALT